MNGVGLDPDAAFVVGSKAATIARAYAMAEATEPPGLDAPFTPDVPEAEQVELAARIVAASGLAGYLAAVEAFLVRYVVFPSEHEPVAVALWTAHAHLTQRFETSPLLAITSAEMRSGKTRLLDCLELLTPSPFRVVIPSEAVTYTVLSQRPRRTMLLDEADAIFSPRMAERYEGLRAILNSGNRQGTPVLRVKLDGKRREVEAFDVFGPKAVAGIGDLPDTVSDRAIPVRLKRRAPDEPVAKFRRRIAGAEAAGLDFDPETVTLGTDVPVPDELNDRAADSWEPLLAIADAAGGSWPARARLAALALSGEDETPATTGTRLLADIRGVFGDTDHLTTPELLSRLHELDGSPWAEWYGKPLTARALARLLEPYRVNPMQRRLAGEKSRGYFRSSFEDAWARYCLPLPGTGTTGTSGTTNVEDAQGTGTRPGLWSVDRAPAPDVPVVPVPPEGTEDDPAVRVRALLDAGQLDALGPLALGPGVTAGDPRRAAARWLDEAAGSGQAARVARDRLHDLLAAVEAQQRETRP